MDMNLLAMGGVMPLLSCIPALILWAVAKKSGLRYAAGHS
jgi:hypothetical protein